MINLKIIFININSLVSRQKRHYFNLFIKEQKPDIILVAEHKLNKNHNLNINGYNIYRQHRNGRMGGGTAIIIKETFISERIDINLQNIEATVIKLRNINGENLFLASLYLRPPDILSKNYLIYLEQMKE